MFTSAAIATVEINTKNNPRIDIFFIFILFSTLLFIYLFILMKMRTIINDNSYQSH